MIEVNGIKLDPHKISMIADYMFVIDGLKIPYGGMFTKEQLEEALVEHEELIIKLVKKGE